MKKMVVILALILLMPSSALAFKNEPSGWQGWAWGTTLTSVQGGLNLYMVIETEGSKNPAIILYTKKGETNMHLQTKWSLVNYAFINGKLEGVILLVSDASIWFDATMALTKQFGGASDSIELLYGEILIETWQGDNSAVTALTTHIEKGVGMLVFIGTRKMTETMLYHQLVQLGLLQKIKN